MVSPIQLKHAKESKNNRKQHLNLLMIKFGNNNLHFFFVQLFNMKEVPEIPQLEDRLPCI